MICDRSEALEAHDQWIRKALREMGQETGTVLGKGIAGNRRGQLNRKGLEHIRTILSELIQDAIYQEHTGKPYD